MQCSFLEGFELTLKTLLQKGRPFIMCGFASIHFSEARVNQARRCPKPNCLAIFGSMYLR
jgi:hypothetical protein